MSCYFRGLKDILAEAEITVTPANRKLVDRAFHQIAAVDYKNCPAANRNLKVFLADKEKRQELVRKLKLAVLPD